MFNFIPRKLQLPDHAPRTPEQAHHVRRVTRPPHEPAIDERRELCILILLQIERAQQAERPRLSS